VSVAAVVHDMLIVQQQCLYCLLRNVTLQRQMMPRPAVTAHNIGSVDQERTHRQQQLYTVINIMLTWFGSGKSARCSCGCCCCCCCISGASRSSPASVCDCADRLPLPRAALHIDTH
jgi:hypothetical protein